MKNYGVEPKQPKGGREILPAGGYVCQILSAKVDEAEWGDTLVIAHDVCEGEYEGFFKRDYDKNTFENKKWRGTFRLKLPKENGDKYDSRKKDQLAYFMGAIEASNPGFEWGNWDTIEKRLKGKKVGLIYRNKEWECNGRTGWTTEAAGADSIDSIRDGKFYHYKDKSLPEKPASAPAFEELDDSESDLPF